MASALAAFLEERFAQWIRRRQGTDRLPVTLTRRRLYILPTRAGTAFAGLLFLMLIAGLNYGNSLALFLTFLLGAFALVVMQQCHRNLLGVEVAALVASPVFAPAAGTLQVTLVNPQSAPRPGLEVSLGRETPATADLPPRGRRRFALALTAAPRGIVRVNRLRVATAHPFGLFRAWTWVHAPVELWVYPRPHGALPLPLHDSGFSAGHRARRESGTDEWSGLRPFRHGDSPRSVDWKAYAREAPLLVKEYALGAAELRLLDFDQLRGRDIEARLSQLARWVVDAQAQGERYSLALPGALLPVDRGPEHRHRCLAALAGFGLPATR